MAEENQLADSYGAEAGNQDVSFMDQASSLMSDTWLGKEVGEAASAVGYGLSTSYDMLKGMKDSVSDWGETKIFNTLDRQGISDYAKYEEFSKYAAAMDDETRQQKQRELVEKGVIADLDKFQQAQKDAEKEFTPQERSLQEDISQRRESFRQKAVERFRAAGALGDDVSSPEARRLMDGINEVAADYVTNYAKISGDETGKLDKDSWNKKFNDYENDMLDFMSRWASNVKSGKTDSEAYDAAAKENDELMKRVRDFDTDLTMDSLVSPAKKYLDQVFSSEEEDSGAVKTGLQVAKLGLSALSAVFGGIDQAAKRVDVGVRDVEGLEELQHTDNQLLKEVWESAPEILTAIIPFGVASRLEKVAELEKGSRAAKYFRNLSGEMAGDFFAFDPYAQAIMGTGFKEEDFAGNFGTNLLFNGLIAFKAKGGDNAINKSLLDEEFETDPNKFGVTKGEIEDISKGDVESARVKMMNRIFYGTTEDISDVRLLDDSTKARITQVFDGVRKGIYEAKEGTADSKTLQQISGAILYDKGITDAGVKQVKALSELSQVVDSSLERGDATSLGAYNLMLLADANKKGLLKPEEVEAVSKRLREENPSTEADAYARGQISAVLRGLPPEPVPEALKGQVSIRRREITQALVDEILIKQGRLPVGAKVYGTYRKTENGLFRHIPTGEMFDASRMSEMSKRFNVSEGRKASFVTSLGKKSNVKFYFENELPSVDVMKTTLSDVIARGNVNELSELEYRTVALSLRPAIEAAFDFTNNASTEGAVITSKKVMTEKQFFSHPIMKMWKKNADGTYSFSAASLGFKTKFQKELSKRVSRAMTVMSPAEFVSELKIILETGTFIKSVDDEVKTVKKAVDALPISTQAKDKAKSAVDVTGELVKKLTEDDPDAAADDLMGARLNIGKTELTADELDMAHVQDKRRASKAHAPKSEAEWPDGIDWDGWNRISSYYYKPEKDYRKLVTWKNENEIAPDTLKRLEGLGIPEGQRRHMKELTLKYTDGGEEKAGISSSVVPWNKKVIAAFEEFKKGNGDLYVIAPAIRNGEFIAEWKQVTSVPSPENMRLASIHIPQIVYVRKSDGKLTHLNIFNVVTEIKPLTYGKTHKVDKAYDEGFQLSKQVVEKLGIKESSEIPVTKLTEKMDNEFSEFFKEKYWKKYGKELKLEVLTKESAQEMGLHDEASGAYMKRAKKVLMIDNEDMRVFFHEFGHHMELQFKEISPKTYARLEKWYEDLYKGEYENFGEFFAEFISDAFIRRNNTMALTAKKEGLESVKTLSAIYEDGMAYFKAVVKKFYESVVAVLSGKSNVQIVEDSTNTYFDILLRDLSDGKFAASDLYGQVMTNFVDKTMKGTKLEKADMLTRLFFQMKNMFEAQNFKKFLSTVPEESRDTYVGMVLRKAMEGTLMRKKATKADKFASDTRGFTFNNMLGVYADFFESALPMLQLAFKEADGGETLLSNAFHTRISSELNKIMDSGNGMVELAVPSFYDLLKRAEADAMSEKKFKTAVDYYSDFFMHRGRFSRLASYVRSNSDVADEATAIRTFRGEFWNSIKNDIGSAWGKTPQEMKMNVLRQARNYRTDALYLAMRGKIADTEVLEELILSTYVMEEKVDSIVKTTVDYEKSMASFGGKVKPENPVYARFKASIEAYKAARPVNVIGALRGEFAGELKHGKPSPEEMTKDGLIRKAILVSDDIRNNAQTEIGEKYYGLTGDSIEGWKFEESAIGEDDLLVVPRNVLYRAFVLEKRDLDNLREFILKNPERIRVTEARIMKSDDGAFIHASDKEFMDNFEMKQTVPSYGLNTELATKASKELVPPGTMGFNFATGLKRGPTSIGLAMDADFYKKHEYSTLLVAIRNTEAQFKKLYDAYFKNKSVTVEGSVAISAMSNIGRAGDMYRELLRSVMKNVNVQIQVSALALPADFKEMAYKNGSEWKADIMAAQYVLRNVLASKYKDAPEELEKVLKAINDKIRNTKLIDREIEMNLTADNEALGLFVKILKREIPDALAGIDDSVVVAHLLSDDGRQMRNMIQNAYITFAKGGILDSSFQLPKADALVATTYGRGLTNVSLEGGTADYFDSMKKTMEKFLSEVTDGKFTPGKRLTEVEDAVKADEVERTGEDVLTEEASDYASDINVQDIFEMFGTSMTKYLDSVKETLILGDAPVRGNAELPHFGILFNAALYGNADWGNAALDKVLKSKEYDSFLKSSQLNVLADDVTDVSKLFDTFGTKESIAALRNSGYEVRFEVSDMTKKYFKEAIGLTDDEIARIIPENPEKAFTSKRGILKFVAAVAFYTRHGNVKAFDIERMKRGDMDVKQLPDRKMSYPLFDVVISKGKDSRSVEYNTNNFGKNPFVRNFFAGLDEESDGATNYVELADKLGPFDTLTLAHDAMVKKIVDVKYRKPNFSAYNPETKKAVALTPLQEIRLRLAGTGTSAKFGTGKPVPNELADKVDSLVKDAEWDDLSEMSAFDVLRRILEEKMVGGKDYSLLNNMKKQIAADMVLAADKSLYSNLSRFLEEKGIIERGYVRGDTYDLKAILSSPNIRGEFYSTVENGVEVKHGIEKYLKEVVEDASDKYGSYAEAEKRVALTEDEYEMLGLDRFFKRDTVLKEDDNAYNTIENYEGAEKLDETSTFGKASQDEMDKYKRTSGKSETADEFDAGEQRFMVRMEEQRRLLAEGHDASCDVEF